MFIICLDMDDAVIDYSIEDVNERIMKMINSLLNIKDLLSAIDGEIFLTSTWSKLVNYNRGNIDIKLDIDDLDNIDDVICILCSMKTVFDGRWYGISSGNRIRDMEILLNDGNKVICLDDMDMSEIKNKNYLWYKMSGEFSVKDRYRIMSMIKEQFNDKM